MTLLALDGLGRRFDGVEALADLSLGFERGGVQSIIGPNGAGKTTLLNLITGVLAPSAGRIRFQGRDITALPPFERGRLGVARTFQNLQVFLAMTVRDNVLVGRHRHLERGFLAALLRSPRLRRSEARGREVADALLEEVGLGGRGDAPADTLPYGGLRRLEIARALATEPLLLLLDEPAAGCNVKEAGEIDALIQKITRRGVTVLLVEHDMRLVMNLSARVVVLDHGRLLADGTVDEVRRDPAVIEAYLGAAVDAA